MAANDSFGREHLLAAWESRFGRSPELHEVQVVQAVARLESGYGRGTYKNRVTGESAVLNNWGATQCGHGPPCGPNCFEVTDTHADGTPYNWCYHRFDTPAEGARHWLGILQNIVNRSSLGWEGALATRSSDAFVRCMKEGRYFEAKLEKYQDGVWSGIEKIATSLGEQIAVTKEEGSGIFSDSGPGGSADSRPFSPDSQASDCSRGPSASGPSTVGDGNPFNDPDDYPFGD